MRHPSAVFAAAVFCLAGVFANGSARADVFNFSFGSGVSGMFTTGAAASDPGYQLITGLTFDLLSGIGDDGFPFSFANLVGEDFKAGASFNPTTDAFANDSSGSHDVGDFIVQDGPVFGSIQGESFMQGSGAVTGRLVTANGGNVEFEIGAGLLITRQTATSVPEAPAWAMTLLGFCGLGFAARRLRPGAVSTRETESQTVRRARSARLSRAGA